MTDETQKARERKERKEGVEELGNLPDSLEDIKKDPILKPMLSYNQAAMLLDKEDESETEYFTNKMGILQKVLDTGIYQDSRLKITYDGVLEIYKRLLFIYSRYAKIADTKIGEVKKIVDKYYITKEEHEKIIKELKKELKKPEETQ